MCKYAIKHDIILLFLARININLYETDPCIPTRLVCGCLNQHSSLLPFTSSVEMQICMSSPLLQLHIYYNANKNNHSHKFRIVTRNIQISGVNRYDETRTSENQNHFPSCTFFGENGNKYVKQCQLLLGLFPLFDRYHCKY